MENFKEHLDMVWSTKWNCYRCYWVCIGALGLANSECVAHIVKENDRWIVVDRTYRNVPPQAIKALKNKHRELNGR